MGSFSIWHWLIVLAVVIIIFGTKKLRNMGGDKQIPGSGRVIDPEASTRDKSKS